MRTSEFVSQASGSEESIEDAVGALTERRTDDESTPSKDGT
jgi:hypothetical protein